MLQFAVTSELYHCFMAEDNSSFLHGSYHYMKRKTGCAKAHPFYKV